MAANLQVLAPQYPILWYVVPITRWKMTKRSWLQAAEILAGAALLLYGGAWPAAAQSSHSTPVPVNPQPGPKTTSSGKGTPTPRKPTAWDCATSLATTRHLSGWVLRSMMWGGGLMRFLLSRTSLVGIRIVCPRWSSWGMPTAT